MLFCVFGDAVMGEYLNFLKPPVVASKGVDLTIGKQCKYEILACKPLRKGSTGTSKWKGLK